MLHGLYEQSPFSARRAMSHASRSGLAGSGHSATHGLSPYHLLAYSCSKGFSKGDCSCKQWWTTLPPPVGPARRSAYSCSKGFSIGTAAAVSRAWASPAAGSSTSAERSPVSPGRRRVTPLHSPSRHTMLCNHVVQPCSCNEVVRLQGSLPAERRTVCPGHALVHVPDTAQNRLEASALLFPQPEVIRATLLGG